MSVGIFMFYWPESLLSKVSLQRSADPKTIYNAPVNYTCFFDL